MLSASASSRLPAPLWRLLSATLGASHELGAAPSTLATRALASHIGQRMYSARPDGPDVDGTSPPEPKRRKVTILGLQELYRNRVPISMMTAHDYPSATWVENAGNVDMCLVGDSLAMVACGYNSTVQLGLEEMLYHCRSVARGTRTPFLVADMPWGTYHISTENTVTNALRIIREGNMEAVKLEGGEEITDAVARLVAIGIPVVGHVGLKPQHQVSLSGFRVQGKTAASALRIYREAKALEAAGAFSIVLEAIPTQLATYITDRLKIPTIGIGAGAGCSGQVLVQLDLLGGFDRFVPRFCKQYMDLAPQATRSIRQYSEEVQSRTFPVEGTHTYPIKDNEWHGFLEAAERI